MGKHMEDLAKSIRMIKMTSNVGCPYGRPEYECSDCTIGSCKFSPYHTTWSCDNPGVPSDQDWEVQRKIDEETRHRNVLAIGEEFARQLKELRGRRKKKTCGIWADYLE